MDSMRQGPGETPGDPERRLSDVLAFLFLASGCAALIYEVIWFHLLRLVIGSSALSLGILLATFMGGMFLGSALLPRVVPAGRHPLRVYGALEIGIGLFGVLLPVALPAVRAVYVEFSGYGAWGIALRALVAGILILPPTALMGATLPAIARRFPRSSGGASALGLLYGANIAGAVLGCGLTGFYLLPRWDVEMATGVAAALNFAAGGIALWLARGARPRAEEPAHAREAIRGSLRPEVVYLVTAVSGMTALGAQVVWTRLLALLFGGTTYTFAIILAVFLAGLAIGSALAASALRRGRDTGELLAFCQLLLVPALLYAAIVIARVLPYSSSLRFTPIGIVHALHVLRSLEVALPATILWGMSFPLALAAAAQDDTGRSTGNVYAANTFGAVLGALGVSLVAIPLWGTQVSERILIAGAGASALVAFLAVRRGATASGAAGNRSRPPLRAGVFASVAVAAPLAAWGLAPGLPAQFQAIGRYIWRYNPGAQVPYVEEGASSTVAVRITPNRTRHFHVAGKVEASTDPLDMRLQRLLGHLSALVHPSPRSVLVVGLGTGVTAGSFVVHPEVSRIVICEIEPRVVGAASRYFGTENHNVLADPRVEVIDDDARHFLATTKERFDVITSDPIHPWVRGNSILFSREYYAIVKRRLNPGGVATQWVPLYETSEAAVKIQMRTFFGAFPDGTVWNSREGGGGYDVVLLGQTGPTRIDVAAIQNRIDGSPRLLDSLSEVGLGSAIDLLASYATRAEDLTGWLEEASVNRDLSLRLEYISGLALNLQHANRIYASMVASRRYPQGLFLAGPEVQLQLGSRIFGQPLP
jgi:spermidine synthase